LGRVVREAKKLYYHELIANSENKVKMTWKIIKYLTGNIQNSQHVSPTFTVDGIEQLPKQATEAFNNSFLNITENLNIHFAGDNNPISLLKKYYPFEFTPIQIVPITEGEIGIISSLKSKHSYGYDGISNKILNYVEIKLVSLLFFIFNKSITMGVFPERLKYVVVIPLHKEDDVSNMAIYRQISLLPVFLKVFEKVTYCRLNQHLQNNNILATEQYRFRKALSNEHAISHL